MADKPGKIEHYEKQFGIIAIEKGFITTENLIETLKIQVEEEIEYKTHRLIGVAQNIVRQWQVSFPGVH